MSRRLRLRPKAWQDIASAFRWYENERRGLGVAFLAELDALLRRICDEPGQYAAASGTTRRALMARFPYAIYFRLGTRAVDVVGVLHTSRDPRRWQVREAPPAYNPDQLAA